jgi:solute carrier family 45, member 1/2/4
MCLLPRSSEITRFLFDILGRSHNSKVEEVFGKFVAAMLVLGLNLAIQPVQMGIRALIVDTCPPDQQFRASAYASCSTGIGSVLGYASAFIRLSRWFPWLGDTQFKCLAVLASSALGSTIVVTLFTIKESVQSRSKGIKRGLGVRRVLRQVMACARLMPLDVRGICKVQFFSWMGWFPFLFYITT